MRNISIVLGLAVALAVTSAEPSVACAQDERVDATPKGAVGLGLVGAELGLVIPAVAGLDETWSLILFPIIGGAGGGLAGFFLLDDKDHEELSVASLAVGMALLIPAMVLTVSATRYDPDDEPTLAPQRPGGDEEASTRRRRNVARAGGGLFRHSDDGWLLGVPALSITPSTTASSTVAQRSNQYSVPLLTGVF